MAETSFCWIPSCDFSWSSELRWLRKTRPSANESTEIRALNVVNREIYLALFLRKSFSRRDEDGLQTAASATAADLAVREGFRVSHYRPRPRSSKLCRTLQINRLKLNLTDVNHESLPRSAWGISGLCNRATLSSYLSFKTWRHQPNCWCFHLPYSLWKKFQNVTW